MGDPDLSLFNLQMARSGHTQRYREDITSRVMAKYKDSLARHISGEKPLYRTKMERLQQGVEEGGKTDNQYTGVQQHHQAPGHHQQYQDGGEVGYKIKALEDRGNSRSNPPRTRSFCTTWCDS